MFAELLVSHRHKNAEKYLIMHFAITLILEIPRDGFLFVSALFVAQWDQSRTLLPVSRAARGFRKPRRLTINRDGMGLSRLSLQKAGRERTLARIMRIL
jgi:hypothetical protein